MYFSSVVSDRTSSRMSPQSILWNLCKIFVTASEGEPGRKCLQESARLDSVVVLAGANVFVCLYQYIRNPVLLQHATISLSQYGDPIIRYAADKRGHVKKILMFILFNQIF